MFKHIQRTIGILYLVCTPLLVTTIARAGTIPAINITYAAGSACWGADCGGATETAAFAGSNFTLNFVTYDSGAGSPYTFSAQAGKPFPDSFFDGQFTQGTSSQNNYFQGTFTVDGQTYDVGYENNPYVEVSGSGTVPDGYGTLVFPAVLTGGGTACTDGASPVPGYYSCTFAPGQTPSFIANVSFDVAGILTVHFSPASEPLYASGSEIYTATFTAVPEGSSAWLAALGLTIAWMAKRFLGERQV